MKWRMVSLLVLALAVTACSEEGSRFDITGEVTRAGDQSLSIELGRYGAHAGVPWLYQPFIRLGSVDWVLARASKRWGELFTAGAFHVRHEPGQLRAEGEIVDFPSSPMVVVYSCLGFSMGCIELSGGKNVTGEVVSARARGAERDLLRVAWA